MLKLLVILIGILAISCGDDSSPQELESGLKRSATGGEPVVENEAEASNEEFLNVAPAYASGSIFVANPTVDSISKIDVQEPHTIEVIPVGLYPSLVKSVGDRVLVLNSGDQTVTFVTAATNRTFTVPIPKEINDIVFNDYGHGIGYVDVEKLPASIEGGSQATDLFSIIDIDQGLVVTKGISFAPKTIVFTRSSPPMALLAADAKGVLVDLSSPLEKPAVVNFSNTLSAGLEEAAVTPDGDRAFFRETGIAGIRAVELASGAKSTVAGDAVPTDMDLSPDGAVLYVSDRAAGYRLRRYDASTAALTLLGTLTSAADFRQTEFSADGSVAVFFSSTGENDDVGIYYPAAGSVTEVAVQQPVSNVLIAPDGKNAVLVHRSSSGPQKITMLDLETGEEPDLDLAGDLEKLVFTPDGSFAFLTTVQPEYVIALSLRTGLHTTHELDHAPIFLSPLAAGAASEAFVTQEHDIGQITFLKVEQTPSTVRLTPDDLVGFLLGAVTE